MKKRRKCGPDEHYDLNVFGNLLLLPAWGWLCVCYRVIRDQFPGKFLRIWSYHNPQLGGAIMDAVVAILPLALIFIFMRTGPIANLRKCEGNEHYDLGWRGYLLLLPSLAWVFALYRFLRNEFPGPFSSLWSYHHPTSLVVTIIVAVIAFLPLVLIGRYTRTGPWISPTVVRVIQ
jgi:hypothetical protein